jgi:hypothetical protein
MPAPQILSFVSSLLARPVSHAGLAIPLTTYSTSTYLDPKAPNSHLPTPRGAPQTVLHQRLAVCGGRPPRAPSWHKWRRIIIDLVLVVSSVSSRLFPSRPRNATETGGWLPKHFAIRHRSSYGISRDGMGYGPPRQERGTRHKLNSDCGGRAQSGTVGTWYTGLYNPVPLDTQCGAGHLEYFLGTVYRTCKSNATLSQQSGRYSQAALSKQANGEILPTLSTH